MILPFPMGAQATGSVDGYALAINAGPPVETVATNAATGAVVVGVEYATAADVAAAQSGPDVVVTWTDPGIADTWQFVERSADGGATWSQIGHAVSSDEGYTDATVPPGAYVYRTRTGPDSSPSVARSAYSETASVAVDYPVLSATPSSGPAGAPTEIAWTPIAGATSYKFQVASDAAFTNIVFEDVLTSSPLSSQLPGSTLYLRLRAEAPVVGQWSNTVTLTA